MATAANESTFKKAYETLRRNAQTLREQEEPDIDNLLQIVTSSIDAYGICKRRIDAVEEALKQAFARGDAQLPPARAEEDREVADESTAPDDDRDKPRIERKGGGKFEDDIPF